MIKSEGVPPVPPAKLVLRFSGRGNNLRRRFFGKRDAKSVTIIIGLGANAKQGWVIFAPAPQGGMEVSWSQHRPNRRYGDFDTELALTNLDDLRLARMLTGKRLPISLRKLHKILTAGDVNAVDKPPMVRRLFGSVAVANPTPGKIKSAVKWLFATPKKTAKP